MLKLEEQLIGKKIKSFQVDSEYNSYDEDEICILSMEMEDGTIVYFEGSPQIGVDGVWMSI